MRHKVEVPGTPPINEVYYELHEVHYDDNGKTLGWTESPKAPFGDTPDELIECLERMLKDAKKCKDDILDYEAEPESDAWEKDLEELEEKS